MTNELNYLHTQTSDSGLIHSETPDEPEGAFGERRLLALANLLDQVHADILFSDHFALVQYLCGFRGSNGTLLIDPAREPTAYLCTDGRYLEQATQQAAQHGVALAVACDPILGPKGILGPQTPSRIVAVDMSSLSLTNYLALREAGHELVDVAGQLATMRAHKDPTEIAAIAEASRVADLAIEATLAHLDDQPTELALAGWFEYYVRHYGGEGVSFPTIVASGARTSLPHARPTRQPIVAPTPVVVDFGAMVNGYCSDSTRSFYLGEPPDAYRQAYEQVSAAKAAGVAQLHPGHNVHAVEEASRASLREHGVEEYLLHGIGHGVGLEIHEQPFTANAFDVQVEPSMCLTVEPGLYFAGDFGIRLEDLYLTTASAPTPLTRSSFGISLGGSAH